MVQSWFKVGPKSNGTATAAAARKLIIQPTQALSFELDLGVAKINKMGLSLNTNFEGITNLKNVGLKKIRTLIYKSYPYKI